MHYLGIYSQFRLVIPKLLVKNTELNECYVLFMMSLRNNDSCELCDIKYHIKYCSVMNDVLGCGSMSVTLSRVRYISLFHVSYIRNHSYAYKIDR